MPEPEQLTFASDVAWKLAGHVMLNYEQAAPIPSAQGLLTPSLTAFYYAVPRAETATNYPASRVLLLKLVPSLTGLRFDFYGPHGQGPLSSYHAPCIGAILEVEFSYPMEPKGTHGASDLYVRDAYPKHQDMIVNELLGQETLARQSNRASTTKSWNAGGSLGIDLGFVNLSGNAAASGSTTTESSQERSQRESRQTQIEHLHHVLTAYHIGGPHIAFTIQPRPFEGETWELARGYRMIEGVQEFMVVLQVPYDVKHVRMKAALTIGLRGARLINPPDIWRYGYGAFPYEVTPPDAGSVQNTPYSPAWDTWLRDYRAYLDALRSYWELRHAPLVVTTQLELEGLATCYAGSDPCLDEPELDPCSLPPRRREATLAARALAAPQTVEMSPRFAESRVRPFSTVEEGGAGRRAANAHIRDLFLTMASAARGVRTGGKRIWETETAKTAAALYLWSDDILTAPKEMGQILLQLPRKQQAFLKSLKVRSFRELAALRGRVESSSQAEQLSRVFREIERALPLFSGSELRKERRARQVAGRRAKKKA